MAGASTHRKTILVFTTEFPPTPVVGALRLGKLCSYLPERGWHPTVLTVSPTAHTPVRNQHTDQLLQPLTYRVAPEVEVEGIWAPNPLTLASRARRILAADRSDDRSGHLIRRRGADLPTSWHGWLAWNLTKMLVPDEYGLWIPRARLAASSRARRGRIDVVWASFPWASAVVAASGFAQKRRIPLILDFRDSWASWKPVMDAPRWRQRVERRIERKAFARASAATAVNEAMSREIRDRHPGFAGVVETLSQGWDPAEAEELRGVAPLSRSDGVLRVTYGGIVRPDISHPGSFFDALALLKRRGCIDPARLQVAFFGNQTMDLEALAGENGIGDIVTVSGHRDRREALHAFARSDLLLMIGIRNDPDWITGKIWDYLTAQRPILAVGHDGTAAAMLLRRTGAGRVAPPDDVSAIADTLEALWKEFESTGSIRFEPNDEEMKRLGLPGIADRAVELFEKLAEEAYRR